MQLILVTKVVLLQLQQELEVQLTCIVSLYCHVRCGSVLLVAPPMYFRSSQRSLQAGDRYL